MVSGDTSSEALRAAGGSRTYRRACPAAKWIEGDLTEGRDGWLAAACEAHVFDRSSLKSNSAAITAIRCCRSLSNRFEHPSAGNMLRAAPVRLPKPAEVQDHCNATLPAQEVKLIEEYDAMGGR